jgi:hypothetical protein
MLDADCFSRPLHGLTTESRIFPAMNRWAIVTRPLARTEIKHTLLANALCLEPSRINHLFNLSRVQSSRFSALLISSASTITRTIDSVFEARTCIQPCGNSTLIPSVKS